jgi:hypothetical protein
MGQAAENERIKLRAAFFNNIAVGSILGGAILPWFVLYQTAEWDPPFTIHWPSNTGRLALTVFVVMMFGVFCRYSADRIASRIRD